jgi:hypothetical protein
MRARRDQTLARTGRGAHDDVRPRDHLDERLLLMWVKDEALTVRPPREGVEDRVRVAIRGQHVSKHHGPSILPVPRRRPPRLIAATLSGRVEYVSAGWR